MAICCLVGERAMPGAGEKILGGEITTYTSQHQKYLAMGSAAWRYLKQLLPLVLQ